MDTVTSFPQMPIVYSHASKAVECEEEVLNRSFLNHIALSYDTIVFRYCDVERDCTIIKKIPRALIPKFSVVKTFLVLANVKHTCNESGSPAIAGELSV